MKRRFFLSTVEQIRKGAAVAAGGFALYILFSALKWEWVASVSALLFGLWALYVFLSAQVGRVKDPHHHSEKDVSYSLLWGTAALMILLLGCGVLGFRMLLGF